MMIRLLSLLLICFFASPTYAATYRATGDLIGNVGQYTVKKGDNLKEIARRLDMGIVELLAANPGITPEKLKEGAKLILPTMHVLPMVQEGIVLNLSDLRLFYFAPDGSVMTFPVGIGRDGWQTPEGSSTIILKRKDPTWTPPDSIRAENPDLPDVVPAGPKNPLGQYALTTGLPGILLHGTNAPYSIGKRSSHGCIRMYPEDIEMLFGAVEEGTPVTIMDTPYKLGWKGNALFLEVTPTQKQADIIAKYQTPPPISVPGIHDAIREAVSDATIDWAAVDIAVQQHTGIPQQIGRR